MRTCKLYFTQIAHEPQEWELDCDLAEQMRVYDRLFAGERVVENVVERIVSLYQTRTHDEREFVAQWVALLASEYHFDTEC